MLLFTDVRCEWELCDRDGSLYEIHFEDGPRKFQLCLDHAAILYERLGETWLPLSDAGDFNATVLLILLLSKIDSDAAYRFGLRAIRYAWRDRKWRNLWNVTSG